MHRGVGAVAAALVVLVAAGCGSSGDGKAASRALVSIGAGLKGPAGLRATVYAKGPATTATAAFDARGRLWLAAAGLSTHGKDGVYLVAKPDAGVRAVLVDGLNDPLGLVWRGGTLYVASVGRVDLSRASTARASPPAAGSSTGRSPRARTTSSC